MLQELTEEPLPTLSTREALWIYFFQARPSWTGINMEDRVYIEATFSN